MGRFRLYRRGKGFVDTDESRVCHSITKSLIGYIDTAMSIYRLHILRYIAGSLALPKSDKIIGCGDFISGQNFIKLT